MPKKTKSQRHFLAASISLDGSDSKGAPLNLPTPEEMSLFPDLDTFLERMDADAESAFFILEATLESEPQKKAELERAVRNKDTASALAVAHKLKGSTGMLGASHLNRATSELERLIESGNWKTAQAYFETMQPPLSGYLKWLDALKRDLSSVKE